MPTVHVEPSSGEHLQDIADSLLKARKIVVVTGAGISTNSGIPDFRSENGLYSLIQAQFDAAAKQVAQKIDTEATRDGAKEDLEDRDRPAKRRRASDAGSPKREEKEEEGIDKTDTLHEQKRQEQLAAGSTNEPESPSLPEAKTSMAAPYSTPRSARHPLSLALGQLPTSPLSSPPPDEQIVPPSAFRFAGHLSRLDVPHSSSPLSSPPTVLFDPFESSSASDTDCNEPSNTSDSESEDRSAARKLFASSQGSSSGRSTLPNMKGRDLFDVSVWADPVRTQVFYTFATSLRQKIKDAEPTGSHRFISHLRNRGKLVRCYTQNIDQIEEKVGLSTSLIAGPGSRGRFSRRSTANKDQLAKMVDEASSTELPSSQNSSSETSTPESVTPQASQASVLDAPPSSQPDAEASFNVAKTDTPPATLKKEPSQSGVECVFLHGSLELLRCFLCGQACSWDDEDRETATLTGQQPECPRCAGAAAEREEKGKRALGVGKLRPDIVLYGEEHPNAHLISPIITHDLALYPDMLLILGTSLRVHGLKVMVREFAKTVHSKGGKVVFVNFTKPSESSWGDVIDFWIQWDCDAWVNDLQARVPKLWRDPSPKKPRPPAANPVAMRDSKVTGAYCTLKILKELRRITGKETPEKALRRATITADSAPSFAIPPEAEMPSIPAPKLSRPRAKGPRKSAPGALEKAKNQSSTLNPNHGRSRKSDAAEMAMQEGPLNPMAQQEQQQQQQPPQSPVLSDPTNESSILNSVKSNPRVRKRKMIDGEEVVLPTRRGTRQSKIDPGVTLPPLRPGPESHPFGKPLPMEPRSPPTGPLTSLSPNLRWFSSSHRPNPFYIDDPLVGLLEQPSLVAPETTREPHYLVLSQQRSKRTTKATQPEADAAVALADLGTSPLLRKAAASQIGTRGLEDQLQHWGARWNCNR
ncbi:Sir2 family protein [Cordyceps fumosorosea ARSEF 2679]|uniref:Sir2 family protein n=1 Tax=Cordyceps fumosorosea (strain ARSEF 2679) TaxID=1081104 RepID=A0A168B7E9_CORFA|nr:Sir2 family protein [Cordyceps fumosorosea ARSEF 2679]OAA69726.1 Sir2 family protein [Cordyceps fumosorosea ARSEF 2679]